MRLYDTSRKLVSNYKEPTVRAIQLGSPSSPWSPVIGCDSTMITLKGVDKNWQAFQQRSFPRVHEESLCPRESRKLLIPTLSRKFGFYAAHGNM